MKGKDFKKLFPHYYVSKFIVGESEVDFVRDEDGIVITVDAEFFKKRQYTKFLGISVQDQNYLRVYGIRRYAQVHHVLNFESQFEKYQEDPRAYEQEKMFAASEKEEFNVRKEKEQEEKLKKEQEAKLEKEKLAKEKLEKEKLEKEKLDSGVPAGQCQNPLR